MTYEARSRSAFRYLAMAFVALLFLMPLVVMVIGSLRTPGLPPPDGFELAPDSLHTSNYRFVFDFIPLWTYMKNSFYVVLVAVPLTVLIGSWAGFTIATAEPRKQKRLIVLSLIALMVPLSALWVPRFVMFKWLGLVDTLWPLIAPALMATTPFYVLLFALTYARIPKNLVEAARLEGLSPFGVWKRVAWPLGRPTTFAVAVLAFVWHWSNFIDPLLFLRSPGKLTAPLALRSLQTLEPTMYPIFLAGAVIVTIPALIAFLLAQRAFFTKTLEV